MGENGNLVKKVGVELVTCVSCRGTGKSRRGKGKTNCRKCGGKGRKIGEVATADPRLQHR